MSSTPSDDFRPSETRISEIFHRLQPAVIQLQSAAFQLQSATVQLQSVLIDSMVELNHLYSENAGLRDEISRWKTRIEELERNWFESTGQIPGGPSAAYQDSIDADDNESSARPEIGLTHYELAKEYEFVRTSQLVHLADLLSSRLPEEQDKIVFEAHIIRQACVHLFENDHVESDRIEEMFQGIADSINIAK